MQDTQHASTFSGHVLALFSTHVFAAVAGIVNGILLARLLGPEAKGDYTFLVLLPASAVVLSQLGLPQAFMFFSARGQTLGAIGRSFVLAAVLSVAVLTGVLLLVGLVQDALPENIQFTQVLLALIALPLALHVTFSTGIVMGRKGVRWYAGINTAYPFITTLLLVIVLGGFGPSVNGALAVYLITIAIQATAFAIGARRIAAANSNPAPLSYRDLFGYGLTYYPASLSSFFNYRVDIYLIAFLTATGASAAIGYYSLAVGLAEMIFFFPTAVSTMFFPHVAGAPREESDRQVAMVSRVTLLVTTMFALLLIPAAAAMIWFLLPAFTPAFPALLVLLPGVVALSAANVVGGFITGIGRPGVHSSINVTALLVNVVANVLLIPTFGIVGAAVASLVSYSLSALLLITIAAHFSGTPVADFWFVRLSDVRYTLATVATLVRRLRESAARAGAGGHT